MLSILPTHFKLGIRAFLSKKALANAFYVTTSVFKPNALNNSTPVFYRTYSEGKWSKKMIGFWMIGCAGMVYGAVVIGGLTRFNENKVLILYSGIDQR